MRAARSYPALVIAVTDTPCGHRGHAGGLPYPTIFARAYPYGYAWQPLHHRAYMVIDQTKVGMGADVHETV